MPKKQKTRRERDGSASKFKDLETPLLRQNDGTAVLNRSSRRLSEYSKEIVNEAKACCIVSCPCFVLQPLNVPVDENWEKAKKRRDPDAKTLVPSQLCIVYLYFSDKDDSYHLTVLKKKANSSYDEIFLSISLEKYINGDLKYNIKEPTWHEVTLIENDKQKQIVFDFDKDSNVGQFTWTLSCVLNGVDGIRPGNAQMIPNMEDPSVVVAPTRPRVAQPSPFTVLQSMVDHLQAAILAGDSEKAKQISSRLAAEKVCLDIKVDEEEIERRRNEDTISVKVHVEDRQASGCPITIQVKPSDTIADLKRKMDLEYNLPVEVQKWIIGRRIPTDSETLRQCKVTASGYIVFLYLITAKAAGINSNQADDLNTGTGQISIPSDVSGVYTTMNNRSRQSMRTTLPRTDQPPNRQVSNVSSASGGLSPSMEASYQNVPDRQMRTSTQSSPQSQGQGQGQVPNPLETGGGDDVFVVGPAVPSGGNLQSGNPMIFNQPAGSRVPLEEAPGWECPACTFINLPTRPGCEVCSTGRPADYLPPIGYVMSQEELCWLANQEEQERMVAQVQEQERRKDDSQRAQNLQALISLDNRDLIPNTEPFDCPVCFDTIIPGDGVVLRECLHTFCCECLMNAVRTSEEASLKCPFQDDEYSCTAMLQDREIRALVSDSIYARYLQRSLDTAESQAANSYHCKTPDCQSWCIYEDLVNFFLCPVCRKENCLTCKAIHENMNCQQYQDDLKIRAANDEAAQQTTKMLERLVAEGEAMPCPQCRVIVQKKDGCDWIRCSICKTEICWVTKGPRWGPNGEGDISGGCGCRVNGAKCDPLCNNCH